MSAKLDFRLARPEEAESISSFNVEAGREYYSPDYWRWKYFENPWGTSGLAVAVDGNRLVGQQGVFALPMFISGKVHLAYQASDNFILDTHRAGNVYFNLIAVLSNGIPIETAGAFVLGVAAELTRDASILFLGYETVAPIRKLVKIVNPGPHLRRRLRLPFLHLAGLPMAAIAKLQYGRALRRLNAEVQVSKTEVFDNRYDELWRASPKARITVSKHSRYLNWRFVGCPVAYEAYSLEIGGELQGFVVVHRYEEQGIVFGVLDELVARHSTDMLIDQLVTLAIGTLVGQGVDAIVCWQRSGTELDGALKRQHFVVRYPPRTLIVRGGYISGADGFLNDETNWSYMIADSDYWILPRA